MVAPDFDVVAAAADTVVVVDDVALTVCSTGLHWNLPHFSSETFSSRCFAALEGSQVCEHSGED